MEFKAIIYSGGTPWGIVGQGNAKRGISQSVLLQFQLGSVLASLPQHPLKLFTHFWHLSNTKTKYVGSC
jgi:hypothetical protein